MTSNDTHIGMPLNEYLNACADNGVGFISLASVMADTASQLDSLAVRIRANGSLGDGRRNLSRIVDATSCLCASLGKNDGWLYLVVEVKARDVLSFAGRLELAAMKVRMVAAQL